MVKVREIMKSHLCQISSSAMLSEAADRMKALDMDILPVVEDRRIVGTIAGRDIAARTLSARIDLSITPVKNLMMPEAVCCSREDDMEKAVRLMETSRVRRLIVLDSCGRGVGVLSADDLVSETSERSHTRPPEGENHESPRY